MLHPLILAVLALDLCCAVLVGGAARVALGAALRWTPASASREQLRLERLCEVASMMGRLAFWLNLLGDVALVAAIAGALPDVVPGAMCGTGVVRASDGAAERALLTRGLALAGISAWHLLDRLDRTAPDSPLAPRAARAMLLCVPLVALATWDGIAFARSLDPYRVVTCCTFAPDVAAAAAEGAVGGLSSLALPVAAAGALSVLLAGAWLWRSRQAAGWTLPPLALALLCFSWVPPAALALVLDLAPYRYQVLHHHCPWCLFLGEHGGSGYLLFGTLLLVLLEGGAAALAAWIGSRVPQVAVAARDRARAAGLRVALATLVFVVFAGGPALLWQVRFGVWMG